MAEIQMEAQDAFNAAKAEDKSPEDAVSKAKKRLSSHTPPPRKAADRVATAAAGTEWIPWPDLDSAAPKPAAAAGAPSSGQSMTNELANLSEESRKK